MPGLCLIIDFFAGGRASTGLTWALGRSPDIAINHDAEALAVNPLYVTGGQPVDVLVTANGPGTWAEEAEPHLQLLAYLPPRRTGMEARV